MISDNVRMIVKMDDCELPFCLKVYDIIAINYFVTDRGFHFKYLLLAAFLSIHFCFKIS